MKVFVILTDWSFKNFFMSPRSSEQYAEIRENSREKILNAAMELFAERGYHNTSIEQIRKEAEVSKGLIYNYFEKKEDLMTAIVMDAMKEGDDIVAQMESRESAEEKIRFIIDLSFDFMVKRYKYSRLMTSLSLQIDQFPDLEHIIKGKYQGLMPLVGHLFRQLGLENPDDEARLFGAIMDGVGLQYIVLKDTLPIEEIKNYLIQKYTKS